jgi:hypothetical protein
MSGEYEKAMSIYRGIAADAKAAPGQLVVALAALAADVGGTKPVHVRAEAPAPAPPMKLHEIITGLRKILENSDASDADKKTARKALAAILKKADDEDEKDDEAKARLVASALEAHPEIAGMRAVAATEAEILGRLSDRERELLRNSRPADERFRRDPTAPLVQGSVCSTPYMSQAEARARLAAMNGGR